MTCDRVLLLHCSLHRYHRIALASGSGHPEILAAQQKAWQMKEQGKTRALHNVIAARFVPGTIPISLPINTYAASVAL